MTDTPHPNHRTLLAGGSALAASPSAAAQNVSATLTFPVNQFSSLYK